MTHGQEKSDLFIVALKPANKLRRLGARRVIAVGGSLAKPSFFARLNEPAYFGSNASGIPACQKTAENPSFNTSISKHSYNRAITNRKNRSETTLKRESGGNQG